jgi:hypothetical protein
MFGFLGDVPRDVQKVRRREEYPRMKWLGCKLMNVQFVNLPW